MLSSVSVSFPRAVCNAAKLHVMKCGCCGLYCRWLPYVFKGRATVIVVPSSQHNKVGMSNMSGFGRKSSRTTTSQDGSANKGQEPFTGPLNTCRARAAEQASHGSTSYTVSAGHKTKKLPSILTPLPKCSPKWNPFTDRRLETHSLNSC